MSESGATQRLMVLGGISYPALSATHESIHSEPAAMTAIVKVFGCRPFIDRCCPPRQGRRSKTSKEGNRELEGRRRRRNLYGDLRVAGVCCRAVGMIIKDDFEG